MFKTIEEGLEEYKNKLKEYLEWVTMCRRFFASSYGIPFEETSFMMHSTKDDYQKRIEWGNRLRGMQEALGITNEENKEIITEVKAEIKRQ